MFDAEVWARTEQGVRELPGAAALCERIREGTSPWPEIGAAMSYCTSFPAREFRQLLALGDFDVRWPLTFAAWYWGTSGGSVDQSCADFLAATGLWDQASKVLPEYNGPEWLSDWRVRFQESRQHNNRP